MLIGGLEAVKRRGENVGFGLPDIRSLELRTPFDEVFVDLFRVLHFLFGLHAHPFCDSLVRRKPHARAYGEVYMGGVQFVVKLLV